MVKSKYLVEIALVASFIALLAYLPNYNDDDDIPSKNTFYYKRRAFETLDTIGLGIITMPPKCNSTQGTFSPNTCSSYASKCCNQNVSLPDFSVCPAGDKCRQLLEQFWCQTSCLPNSFCNPNSLWGLIGICSKNCPQLVGKYIPDESQSQSFVDQFANSTAPECQSTESPCKPCKVGIDENCVQTGSDVECNRNCNSLSREVGLCNTTRCFCPPKCRPCVPSDDLNPDGPRCNNPATSPQDCSTICPIGVYDSALCDGSRCVCNGKPPLGKPCRPCDLLKDPFCINPATVPLCQSICPLGTYDSAQCNGSRCTCNGVSPNITSDMCVPCDTKKDPLCQNPASFAECQTICPNKIYDEASCDGSKCTCPANVGNCRPCNPAKDPLCVRPASFPACKLICPLGRYEGFCDGSRCTCNTTTTGIGSVFNISSWTVNRDVSYTNLSISGILELTFSGIVNNPSTTKPVGVIQWVDQRGKLFAEIMVPESSWKKVDDDNSTFYSGFINRVRLDSMRISSTTSSTFYVYLWVQFPKANTNNAKFNTLDEQDNLNENKKAGWSFARVKVTLQRAKGIPIPDDYIPNVCGSDDTGFDTAQIEEKTKPYASINCSTCPQNCKVQFPSISIRIRVTIFQLVVGYTEYRNGNAIIGSFRSAASAAARVFRLVDTVLVFTQTIVIESELTIQYSGSSIVNFGMGSICRVRNHFRSLPPTAIYGSFIVEAAVNVSFPSRLMIYGETGDVNLDHTNATLNLDYDFVNNTNNNITFDTKNPDLNNSTNSTESNSTNTNPTSPPTCTPVTTFTCNNITNIELFNATGIRINNTQLTGDAYNSSVNLTNCITTSAFNSTTNITTNTSTCPSCVVFSTVCINATNNTNSPSNNTNTTNPPNNTTNSTNPSINGTNSSNSTTNFTSEDTQIGPVIEFKAPTVELVNITVITIAESTFYMSKGKCRGKGRVKFGKGHSRHYNFKYSIRVFMSLAIQFSFPARWRAMWPMATAVQGTQTLCASTYGQGDITITSSTGLIIETTCVQSNIVQETGNTLQVSSSTDTNTPVTVGSDGTLAFTKVQSSSVFNILGSLTMDTGSILSVQVTKNPINALFLRWESSSCSMPKATPTITGCDNCEILMDKEGNSHCTLRIATKSTSSPTPSSPSPTPSNIISSPSASISVSSLPSASVPVVSPNTSKTTSSSDNKALLGLIALVAIPVIVVVAILIYFGVKKSSAAEPPDVDVDKFAADEYAPGYQSYEGNTPISTPTYV